MFDSRAHSVAGVAGVPLAGYTGVLVASTAVPAWQEASASMPVLFTASGVAGAASLLMLARYDDEVGRVLRRYGIAGKVGELAAAAAVEREVSDRTPYRENPLWRAAEALTAPASCCRSPAAAAVYASASPVTRRRRLPPGEARRRPSRPRSTPRQIPFIGTHLCVPTKGIWQRTDGLADPTDGPLRTSPDVGVPELEDVEAVVLELAARIRVGVDVEQSPVVHLALHLDDETDVVLVGSRRGRPSARRPRLTCRRSLMPAVLGELLDAGFEVARRSDVVVAAGLDDVSVDDGSVAATLRKIVETRLRRPAAQEAPNREVVKGARGAVGMHHTAELIGAELGPHDPDTFERRDPSFRHEHQVVHLDQAVDLAT